MQTVKIFLIHTLLVYFIFSGQAMAAGRTVAGIDQDRIKRLDDRLAGYVQDGTVCGNKRLDHA